MSTKHPKRPRDANQLAKLIVDIATGEADEQASVTPEDEGKNQHAVALGRLGGKKGGRARAEALTPDQRTDIARLAATARWRKSD